MANAREVTSAAANMMRMEEQRAKQLLDDVLDEYMNKDTRVMHCIQKYIGEITNQYTKHYDVINKIKENFSADVEAIYAVSLSSKYLNHHFIKSSV